MITLARPFLGPPFYPVTGNGLTPHEFPLRPLGMDRFPAAFSTPIGPEESVSTFTRIGMGTEMEGVAPGSGDCEGQRAQRGQRG